MSSPLMIFQAYNNSNLCIFITVSTFLTLFHIRSNFIVSIWLAFSFLYWILKTKFGTFNKGTVMNFLFVRKNYFYQY